MGNSASLPSDVIACKSIRFSFALRRWGRFAKRPQRRRAKEKRMLSQATDVIDFTMFPAQRFWHC